MKISYYNDFWFKIHRKNSIIERDGNLKKRNEPMDTQLINELKENYDIVFHDVNLLEQAFTHSSYVNEHRNMNISDNERL